MDDGEELGAELLLRDRAKPGEGQGWGYYTEDLAGARARVRARARVGARHPMESPVSTA